MKIESESYLNKLNIANFLKIAKTTSCKLVNINMMINDFFRAKYGEKTYKTEDILI